eukprot:gnl/TRDRNA2_/TRDRNA2_184039_c0_seq1.p1 gnl/TRDRNA2_/TRDRNA2_184039_c0~~gnl/TRDRNA2_/TRDRNA2_184039_c0_seq1.p1  ORF type:complete len:306 (+),score=16.38 gnl/TRDRNA2_/TRDRNA2_184039_c0_seq1:40-918(+)
MRAAASNYLAWAFSIFLTVFQADAISAKDFCDEVVFVQLRPPRSVARLSPPRSTKNSLPPRPGKALIPAGHGRPLTAKNSIQTGHGKALMRSGQAMMHQALMRTRAKTPAKPIETTGDTYIETTGPTFQATIFQNTGPTLQATPIETKGPTHKDIPVVKGPSNNTSGELLEYPEYRPDYKVSPQELFWSVRDVMKTGNNTAIDAVVKQTWASIITKLHAADLFFGVVAPIAAVCGGAMIVVTGTLNGMWGMLVASLYALQYFGETAAMWLTDIFGLKTLPSYTTPGLHAAKV